MCKDAMEIIRKYLLFLNMDEGLVEKATAHIANCRRCIEELDATIRLLTGKPFWLSDKAAKHLTCEECKAILPEFSELEEKEAAERYPEAARHLSSCVACAEIFHILRNEVISDDHEKVQLFPSFGDLACLDTNDPPKTNLWEKVKENIWSLAEGIVITLQAGRIKFESFPSLLVPPLMEFSTVEVRSHERGNRASFTIPATQIGLTLEFTLYEAGRQNMNLLLKARKTTGETAEPSVMLKSAKAKRTEQMKAGSIIFQDLKLGSTYMLNIEWQGQTAEIPIEFKEIR